jgi:diguanylate cyclase (GGDEF)-like protein/PAS domain S-box-containing protein
MIANKLLRRQVRRCFGAQPEDLAGQLGAGDVAARLDALLRLVDASYQQSELDIALRTRCLDVSSAELEEANERLRVEIRDRELALNRLRQSALQLLGKSGGDLPSESDSLDALSRLLGHLIIERLRLEEGLKAGERRFRDLAEISSDWFWEQDENFRFTMVSVGISRFMDPQAMLGKTRWELPVLGIDQSQWAAHRAMLDRREPFHDFTFEVEPSPGRRRWFSISGRPLFDSDGSFRGYRGTGRDVTAQRRSEEELRLAASVFDTSAEGVCVTDPEHRILAVNRAFETITGYTRDEALGQTPRLLSSGMHDTAFYDAMWRAISAGGRWQGEIWDRRKSGEIFAAAMSISAIKDASGSVCRYVSVFSDVSERKLAEQRISFLAHHDFLTGLPNRVVMEDRLAHAIALAERNGTRLALLFIDLDRFKNINDSLGHHVGDLVLREVAGRLVACTRKSDTVCRLGGDEFLVILDGLLEEEDAGRIAAKILDGLAARCTIEGHALYVTPSIGISVYPQDGSDPGTLMKNADAAMYHAKKQGRNVYQFFTRELNVKASERLTLENSLRRGLERDEFLLHFQPQLDIRSGRIVGVEALVRWRHPEWNMVSPGRFIPVAEDTGLVIPLGEWILRRACFLGRQWQDRGWALPVAVNISATQFHHKGFMDSVSRALADSGLDPRRLELELTEGVVMADGGDNDARLHRLKSLGISLAIDDFGTGYSNLGYLKRFPLDRLKIDQSFVRDLVNDPTDRAIVQAIIALGRTLGLRTIAEGVETTEQRDRLRALGADEFQGYLFRPPLPVDALERLMEEHAPANVPVEAR